MAISHLTPFPFPLFSFPKIIAPHPKSNPFHLSSHRNLSLTCSAHKSRKGRLSRARMDDVELCKELMEFMVVIGVEDERLPTTKEFTENGRKDLANIVRRRGYKVIFQLLRHASGKHTRTETSSPGNQDTSDVCRDEASDGTEVKSTEMSEELEIYPDLLKSNGAAADTGYVPYCSTTHHSDRDAELDTAGYDLGLASEMIVSEKDNQIEIDQLKTLLHDKEMELSLLKQQIAMEQQALSNLQAKANAESGNGQISRSARDMEVLADEDSLLGLTEVQIEYWANGDYVEVAGSFNGWDHLVKMDHHPPPNTRNQPESRNSKLWSTVLWLYPGVYEIKFIVDGHWQIDSQRETVQSDGIENNILRVDK